MSVRPVGLGHRYIYLNSLFIIHQTSYYTIDIYSVQYLMTPFLLLILNEFLKRNCKCVYVIALGWVWK